MPLVGVLDRLEKIPDVEDAREKPEGKHTLFDLAKHGVAEPDAQLRKEIVVTLKLREAELVVPLPVSASRLASFTRQVEEVLGATIVQQVGSWDKGTTITVLLPGTMPLAGISERLREMPDVEDAREKPVAKNVLSSFARRGGAMPETHLRGQFVVTLKEDITGKQAESSGRGRKKKALVKVI